MNDDKDVSEKYTHHFHEFPSIIELDETEESDDNDDNEIIYNENIYNLIASQSLYGDNLSPQTISHEQIPENDNMNEVNNLLHEANETNAIENYATIPYNQDDNSDSVIVDEEDQEEIPEEIPEEIQEEIPEEIQEEIQEEIPEEIQEKIPEEIPEIPEMNEIEPEYPEMQKVVQEESESESESESETEPEQQVYDIYDSRNYRNKQKKWDMKGWFDSLW